jgi:hypothetical protein
VHLRLHHLLVGLPGEAQERWQEGQQQEKQQRQQQCQETEDVKQQQRRRQQQRGSRNWLHPVCAGDAWQRRDASGSSSGQ